jgi:beta-glucosidase-like glycosyl hydrolase/CubicO group peptidase (beta-lactamase class C family)
MIARKTSLLYLFLLIGSVSFAQKATRWADSVLKTLNKEEKIAQLIMVRLSSIDLRTRKISFYDSTVESDIKKYNIGGICLFQGAPVKQANLVNYFQSIAKTPILIAIDGETGVGMRFDSVANLPKMMMLGAMKDSSIVYTYGQWVAEQCKQLGIQINFAPVADVNNNPNNPVINDRSFGENKYKVANLAVQYMLGMKDGGVMGSGKHFPGHGDVDVDSHLALPQISKSKQQLDDLELYPFRKLFDAGVGSAMVGHLFIPVIDSTPNRGSSVSEKAITGLLKNEMGFKGIVFTDGLEMKGVTDAFPNGSAGVESLIAGVDMMCLPGEVATVIAKTKEAIAANRISWEQIDGHVMKVLETKYETGLSNWKPVPIEGLTERLNEKSNAIKQLVAEKAITLAKYEDRNSFPLAANKLGRYALIDIAKNKSTAFSYEMRKNYNADVFLFDHGKSQAEADSLFQFLNTQYEKIIVAIHELPRYPANNFNMSKAAIGLVNNLSKSKPTNIFVFGNPYASKNFCESKNIIACYDDDPITHRVAANMLLGIQSPEGQLPVSVCPSMPAGTGYSITTSSTASNVKQDLIYTKVDSIINDALEKKAAPGMVLMAFKNGKVITQKTYGRTSYNNGSPTTIETVYDMASVTKICATTLSVMKLVDEEKININQPLGKYLPWVKGSDKENLIIKDILLHQAGLKAWIPFYKEIADSITMKALPGYFSKTVDKTYGIKVDDSLYMRSDWVDTMYKRILLSPVEKKKQYVYSDNDFILLGEVVKSVSGLNIDQYAAKYFYRPLGLRSTGFNPTTSINKTTIAPTEQDPYFRQRLVRGYVHDPGAAMFGGIAGHAGLFSNAYEIGILMEMVLNGGIINGKRYLSSNTVKLFTTYQSDISRRGLGFDKAEKDNAKRKVAYPTLNTSALAFGHTGFTGTCAWADPEKGIVFVLLANRVHPTASNTFGDLNIRGKVMEEIFKAY